MTDPDTAKAATTIQAGFKGFTTRKNWLKTVQAATKIQAGFRSKQVRDILKQYKQGLEANFTGNKIHLSNFLGPQNSSAKRS